MSRKGGFGLNNNFLGGAVVGGLSSGGGGIYGTLCDSRDDTFFCQLSRFTQSIRMILFLLTLIAVPIYFIYIYKKKGKK